MMALLEVKDVSVNYGAIKAVRGISFEVNEGEIVTLIGANGAGKSTIMNAISGLVRPAAGQVRFQGKDITGAKSHEIVKAGITLSPEGRQVFPRLTVRKNLELGGYTAGEDGKTQALAHVYGMFPILKEREGQQAGTLSGGEQQMLAVGRALMASPKLLMLDEPSLGLAPLVVQEIFRMITRIRSQGTTILLVEQNARLALSVSDRGYVLETGEVVLTDTGKNLLHSERVLHAYLGGLAPQHQQHEV